MLYSIDFPRASFLANTKEEAEAILKRESIKRGTEGTIQQVA